MCPVCEVEVRIFGCSLCRSPPPCICVRMRTHTSTHSPSSQHGFRTVPILGLRKPGKGFGKAKLDAQLDLPMQYGEEDDTIPDAAGVLAFAGLKNVRPFALCASFPCVSKDILASVCVFLSPARYFAFCYYACLSFSLSLPSLSPPFSLSLTFSCWFLGWRRSVQLAVECVIAIPSLTVNLSSSLSARRLKSVVTLRSFTHSE